MSHFTVIVCIDDPGKLEAVMAPFDENLDGNEQPKWDWWVIGGRWSGYFPYRAGCEDQVIPAERHWGSEKPIPPMHCDGGPKSALDLHVLRDKKAAQARASHREFAALIEGLPAAEPWPAFVKRVDDKLITIDEARQAYYAQPACLAIAGTDFHYYDDAIGEFAKPESLYVEHARAQAVPGYATITTDGRWMAPGTMGWFALDDADDGSRVGYLEAANAYIDMLPDSVSLIAVDCHI